MPPLAFELAGRMSDEYYTVYTSLLSRTDPCYDLIEYLPLFCIFPPPPARFPRRGRIVILIMLPGCQWSMVPSFMTDWHLLSVVTDHIGVPNMRNK
ncbi:hypothetical protein PILCRDRAFT_696728 [Piloderma croceum F 1598]|uniref:Uncharacterized protein n=1 Tax=Piloderma croceum (strain F 1598) TaxID=765440 RepID=A0A0C3ALH4_PILCF|nr:hypothetical protein PILCRDRAFT_696728 [Piloderma croceum F 1598]